ncbi:YheE family protein [Sporosarcina sp. FSL K6-3508]|uniref:YheE family protein n=1 Tax=Sporosarcina sp. FSL K6-3508 TaxID=2921557 RepID=UPI003159E53F
MLQHFSYKKMFEGSDLPGWTISFYYQNKQYAGDYYKDGSVKWKNDTPPNETDVLKMVHDLMTFHVYE